MYYEVAILNRPLNLTYSSDKPVSPGSVVEVAIRGKKSRAVVIKEVEKPSFKTMRLQPTSYYYSSSQLEIARFISTYYFCSIGEALGLFVPHKEEKQDFSPSILDQPTLSQSQKEAVEFIKKHKRTLLFGDTGSGKTEIYISLMADTLKEGKRALLLMPEISLTPQMEQRLKKFFGEGVVIWHSRLGKKAKEQALEKIYSGKATIIAGPRSSLFLPVKNLGLIVVDEEHDDSYKAQNRPRINAKDIALYMGKKFDIPVVLGSATPLVKSYHNYPVFRLKGTFYKTEKDTLFDIGSGINPVVLQELERVLRADKQALIFVPTRAHFKYLICDSCGSSVKCPYCDVGMSVHFDKRAVVCHYCNFTQFIPSGCECGGELRADRVGTSEIVERLSDIFADKVIKKFDRDEITTHKKLIKTLKDFSQKKIDVLVGTQMLSKGHDYPDVALSVITDIDYMLAMADYRARERAMSLYLQVAGRSGRKERGRVLVQTKNREFFEMYQDYEDFIKDELEFRKMALYPPFVRLAQLNFAHKEENRAKEAMEEVLKNLKNFDVTVVGYGKNAIEKIASKYRYHILIKSASAKKLLEAIYASKNELCEVDIDPVNIA